MRRLYRLLEQVGPSAASVLITGESGTGKELVARTLHDLSPRREGPFVALNCAAIPETLLESELFGHERGAFTGAETARPGCFELAHGGTLFLDEIGDMPRSLQKKLLRVIEERRLRRLGARVETPVDVRIVSATHADLETLLRRGAFRADLYYRLDVFTVEMVPLRRRPGDVPLLAHHFLARLARENGKAIVGFTPDALDRLVGHDWPGNVRELRNAVERAVVVCEGERVETRHLPRPVRGRPPRRARDGVFVPAGTPLDEAERLLVDHALDREGGNKTRAARSLGIAVRTLHRKLERWRDGGEEA
jgi:DNA-binding NtrC family response regulator